MSSLHLRPVSIISSRAAWLTGQAAWKSGACALASRFTPGLPKPDLSTADSLRSVLLAAPHVAYIDPKGGGTSGPFIARLFERLGVASQMERSGVPSKTGKDVVRAVASGEATCGLTQASELIGAEGVQFAGYIPTELQVISVYAGAVATQAQAPDLAMDFIRFLTSPASAECFRRLGWDAGGASLDPQPTTPIVRRSRLRTTPAHGREWTFFEHREVRGRADDPVQADRLLRNTFERAGA